MAKQDEYTRYTIRIPTPLYERVKAAAGEASVNSLIVATLEEKYPTPKGRTPKDMVKLLNESLSIYDNLDIDSLDGEAKKDYDRLTFLRDFFLYRVINPEKTIRDFENASGRSFPA